MKNGDAIRQMSDEELAKWLSVITRKIRHIGSGTVDEWIYWLKQEVESDG